MAFKVRSERQSLRKPSSLQLGLGEVSKSHPRFINDTEKANRVESPIICPTKEIGNTRIDSIPTISGHGSEWEVPSTYTGATVHALYRSRLRLLHDVLGKTTNPATVPSPHLLYSAQPESMAMEALVALAQARDIPVPNDLHTVNPPERIEALRRTLYQHLKWGKEPNVPLLFIPSEPLPQVEVDQTPLENDVHCTCGKWLWRSCSTWRLNSNKGVNLNFEEQAQTGDFLAQMEGDLPAQANTVNVGSSILHGASLPVISGGEFSSSGGDHNRIIINIHQGLQRHRDDWHESSSTHQGQRNLSRDRTPSVDDSDSPDFSDGEDEECIVLEDCSNAIYERQMLPKKRGFPLWIPQPNLLAPLMHRRNGVIIGDLGRVTAYGAFDVLFNICKAAGRPDNPDELPDGFTPLNLKANDIHLFQEYTSGSYIASASVKKLRDNLSFQCSNAEGAILTMPDGAFREDLRSTTLFRDFAAENAESWYRFINGPCGWELENGKLHLITGCDKTTSWGLAAYQNTQSETNSSGSLGGPVLRFRNANDAGDYVPGTTYCWEHEGTADAKAGPEFEFEPSNGVGARNQCTFIRSHTIMLSEAKWARVQSSLVSALDSRRASKPAQPQSTNSSNFLTSAFSHLSIFGSSRNTGSAMMSDSHNPSAHPGADVAIVHDDHWGAVIGENEDRIATGPELWRRVQATFDTILNFKVWSGAMYLSERSATPDGINTQPESSIPKKKVSFAGPSVVVPLRSGTTSIAVAQAPASPQFHASTSPVVKGKSATVTAPSEAQNDGSQSTGTSFASPVDHHDFVGVSIGFTPPTYLEDEDEAYDSMSNAVNSEMDAFPNIILLPFAINTIRKPHGQYSTPSQILLEFNLGLLLINTLLACAAVLAWKKPSVVDTGRGSGRSFVDWIRDQISTGVDHGCPRITSDARRRMGWISPSPGPLTTPELGRGCDFTVIIGSEGKEGSRRGSFVRVPSIDQDVVWIHRIYHRQTLPAGNPLVTLPATLAKYGTCGSRSHYRYFCDNAPSKRRMWLLKFCLLFLRCSLFGTSKKVSSIAETPFDAAIGTSLSAIVGVAFEDSVLEGKAGAAIAVSTFGMRGFLDRGHLSRTDEGVTQELHGGGD
ncbi:uncharacterized protein LACBIDRAFT_328934 [Laccaria bicolor S238N-H82]|uniref:Predicted protein n=1 Tax=Laccaria bicolor (strain S238N-H82 / ATCC MYA-4686) TaxID=486041 RepID=B0DGH5_LACBS|nr:uncharacterized protein LACBIDRAFT_328934 [Laccaria bicolor S238N-H82]EDR06270.1 predicted protein [Laccaria bicolor S238N-H82]|eukprot:XP_001883131.1 predicted protein [Laccaria bicolor S238N-H82]